MRSILLAAVVVGGVLLGAVPGSGPASVAAASPPKVAIIVGPVGGSTAGYKRDADAAAAEALKYTPNVVKVYTPNATWTAARAALQDASIVIYMGHGNGFPSPYTSTMAPDRHNGLGLNPTAGGDDSTTKYYGEQYLRNEVRLASNAVVILGHLCYASGSSEPGKPDPTLEQARQRIDNFASGFLAIGARAVISEAYGSASANYVAALFTTRQTVFDMWLTSSASQGNPTAFASTRTPGATAYSDPDRSSGKFYRSIVGDPALMTTTTSQTTPVTISPNGDRVNDTWTAKLLLGGAGTLDATVTAPDGAPVRRLLSSTNGPTATITWDGQTDAGIGAADGRYTVTVTGRDAAGNTGPTVAFSVVVYRAIGSVTTSATVFYPQDGDTLAGSTRLGFSLTQPATVTWQIVDAAGTPVLTTYDGVALLARSISLKWDGRDQAGNLVPAGTYDSVLTVTNGVLTDVVRTRLTASAFALTPSVSTVVRGGSVTITAISAEPLKASPKLTYTRPGLAAQTVTMSKIKTGTYRLTIRLSNNGGAGTMAFKVTGIDTRGGTNASTLSLPLR
ncbi:MAG: hypothetical protein FJ038_04720 [Chloroflexi bacterium]|nr:hypothetical protein [Chloroflexota bacterium]